MFIIVFPYFRLGENIRLTKNMFSIGVGGWGGGGVGPLYNKISSWPSINKSYTRREKKLQDLPINNLYVFCSFVPATLINLSHELPITIFITNDNTEVVWWERGCQKTHVRNNPPSLSRHINVLCCIGGVFSQTATTTFNWMDV